MKRNRGQNTLEYLVFFTGVTVFFIMFLGKGFPTIGPGGWPSYQPSPFQTVFRGILRQPGDTLGDQTRETSTLDVYSRPGIQTDGPGAGISMPGAWYSGSYPHVCPTGVGIDTCSAIETIPSTPDQATDCDPAAAGGTGTYTCNEFKCERMPDVACAYRGTTPPCNFSVQFQKVCTGGLLLGQPNRDTCPGVDDMLTYQCQPTDNFTCLDYSWDLYIWTHNDPDTGVGGCVGTGCYMSAWYFFFKRTVECRPFQLPGN